MAAPESCFVAARSASAVAAAFRSARSIATQRPPERISGRASLASRAMSAAVSSTSSKTADHRTSASWLAPTTDVAEVSANTRSIGVGRCGDSSGIRTSNPAAASRGPVIAISSHASSWLRITWPRRVPPGRRSAGSIRSRRVISSSRSRRFEPALTMACSIGTKAPLSPEAKTARFHASPRSGGSSRTINAACSRVTDRAQSSARSTSSPATRSGASNALPSSRARNASVTSAAVRTLGGGAGTSIQRALSRQIASTMPVSAERVRARASTLGSIARTLPGISSARSLQRSASTKAGIQRTEKDALELLAVRGAACAGATAEPSLRAR